MILIEASWPSNNDAAVTKRILLTGLYSVSFEAMDKSVMGSFLGAWHLIGVIRDKLPLLAVRVNSNLYYTMMIVFNIECQLSYELNTFFLWILARLAQYQCFSCHLTKSQCMKHACLPANEAARLAALKRYAVLDTPAMEDFDQYTRLAAAICGTPIALISLIDTDRQWFKSRVGLTASETARDISFCGHAIHSDQLFEIPDTLTDLRFVDNPLVTGSPHIRFYAGQPLMTLEGLAIGTLCVIDNQPHQLQDSQRAALQVLAKSVVKQLDLSMALQREQQLNAELVAQNNFRKTLLESAGLAIISTDCDGLITSVNPGAQQMLGYCAEDLAGVARLSEFVYIGDSADDAPIDLAHLMHSITTGGAQTSEVVFRHSTGRVLPVELTISVLHDVNGAITGHLALGMDISERKLLDQTKNEFISLVSHELRTPLTSIRASLGLLDGNVLGELPVQMRNVINVANRNCQRLMALVNDILDMEKLLSKKMSLQMQRINLVDLIKQSLQDNADYATTYEVKFALQDPGRPLQVIADSGRLSQVIANLLSNAAKFSLPGGQVDLRILTEGSQLRIEVEDRGTGIAPEFQPLIFAKFAQADHGNTRHQGGTGLGLNISRMLIEKMNGQMGFTTRIGYGSVFWVCLQNQTLV